MKSQTACIQRYQAHSKEAWEHNLMGELKNELLNAPNALRSPRVEQVYPADHFSMHIETITNGNCREKYINLTLLDITATTAIQYISNGEVRHSSQTTLFELNQFLYKIIFHSVTEYYPSPYGSNRHASRRPGCVANLQLGHASRGPSC